MGSRYQAVKQGGPLEIVQVSKPEVAKNEVLINNKAVALNAIDFKRLDFGVFVSSWPATFGSDAAGVVEAVGEDVKSFKPGDEVFAQFGSANDKTAAFQSYAALDWSRVAHKPAAWSFEDAASLPTTFVTAVAAIYAELGIPLPFILGTREEGYQPDSILVLGGSSGVGASTIQLLRLALPDSTILTTSSSKHHAAVESLGASAAFDYKSPNVVEEIKTASPTGNGVEVIIDAVNSVALNPSFFEVLIGPKHFAEILTGQNVKDVPTGVQHYSVLSEKVYSHPGGENLFAALEDLLQKGKYKLPVPVTVVGKGFEAIGEGLETLKKGISGTKLVVTL